MYDVPWATTISTSVDWLSSSHFSPQGLLGMKNPRPIPSQPEGTSERFAAEDSEIYGPLTTITNITEDQVRCEFCRLHSARAAGPDSINQTVFKTWADQLCWVVLTIFNLSLSVRRVQVLGKTSCLFPVQKKARSSFPSDYRLVVLTSHCMNALERLMPEILSPTVRPALNPLQFACQAGMDVDNAIIYLLHHVYSYPDKPGGTPRIMFFNFSSTPSSQLG